MKTSEAERKLSKAGCSFVMHGGEHDCWYSPITKSVSGFRDTNNRNLQQVQNEALKKTQGLNFNP